MFVPNTPASAKFDVLVAADGNLITIAEETTAVGTKPVTLKMLDGNVNYGAKISNPSPQITMFVSKIINNILRTMWEEYSLNVTVQYENVA